MFIWMALPIMNHSNPKAAYLNQRPTALNVFVFRDSRNMSVCWYTVKLKAIDYQ